MTDEEVWRYNDSLTFSHVKNWKCFSGSHFFVGLTYIKLYCSFISYDLILMLIIFLLTTNIRWDPMVPLSAALPSLANCLNSFEFESFISAEIINAHAQLYLGWRHRKKNTTIYSPTTFWTESSCEMFSFKVSCTIQCYCHWVVPNECVIVVLSGYITTWKQQAETRRFERRPFVKS